LLKTAGILFSTKLAADNADAAYQQPKAASLTGSGSVILKDSRY